MIRCSLIGIAAFGIAAVALHGCGGEDAWDPATGEEQELRVLQPQHHPAIPSSQLQQLQPSLKQATVSDAVLTLCYPDQDGDRYGNAGATPVAVLGAGFGCPLPLVDRGGDCDDSDARAFPGQIQFFTSSRQGGSWDFDCDGKVEQQYDELPVSCEVQTSEIGCNQWSDLNSPHWVYTIPTCGGTAQIASGWGCGWNGASCSTSWAGERVQPCR